MFNWFPAKSFAKWMIIVNKYLHKWWVVHGKPIREFHSLFIFWFHCKQFDVFVHLGLNVSSISQLIIHRHWVYIAWSGWYIYICNLILIHSIFSGSWRPPTIDQGSKIKMLLIFSSFHFFFIFFCSLPLSRIFVARPKKAESSL